MGTDEVQVQLGAAALAIALTALAIAVAQLLGQLFATADGYRRCQPSVMGTWAKHTKLRWRWSQMRFETLFTTPEIFLCPFDPSVNPMSEKFGTNWDVNWIGDLPGTADLSRTAERPYFARIACLDSKLVDSDFESGSGQELACWLPFLHSVRKNERQIQTSGSDEQSAAYHTHRRSACCSIQRSWDFMAPELLRPLAITNIGDIAIIVQKLGMKWQAFRPEDGEMRAEGNGHIIYSTLVRSIGPILHYAHEDIHMRRTYIRAGVMAPLSDGRDGSALTELQYVQTAEVDMMRFGLMPCHELMWCERLAMGTIDEVYATLDITDSSGSASKKVRDNRQLDPTSTFGFSDLISMAAPILIVKGTTKFRLPVPTEHCIGLTCHREGFVVFRQRLGEYVRDQNHRVSSQVLWVLQSYDALEAKVSSYWEDDNRGELEVVYDGVDEIHAAWDQTTTYFEKLMADGPSYHYLVAAHMKHAVNYWHEAHERIRSGIAREHHGLCDWLAEGMHIYWDYLPLIAGELSFYPEEIIYEAWITLIFRAFCWSRCHYFCRPQERFPDSTRLPSRYWNSKLPVYLG
ncbi:MAG: hypothetical protein L6R41_001859 [Letrouitia leprolyta]|nr:MAG: hypothetical protein L6R41_001859 [Letrouitia leprolyta]